MNEKPAASIRPPNAYQGVGDRCRLSERTVRDAFNGRPITYGTAMTLASVLEIPVQCFRIKADRRGLRKHKSLDFKLSNKT